MGELPASESAPPRPIVSPDGRHYWNGSAWLPIGNVQPQPSRPASNGAIFAAILVGLLIICGGGLFVISRPPQFEVGIAAWSVGSPDVRGWIKDDGSPCSDPRITLTMRDHNDAIVETWEFGAGELISGQRKEWSTHMTSAGIFDHPMPTGVVSVTGAAECADQH